MSSGGQTYGLISDDERPRCVCVGFVLIEQRQAPILDEKAFRGWPCVVMVFALHAQSR